MIRSLILSFVFVSCLISKVAMVQAQEFDMARIQQVIQENKALDTEKKTANMLIAYSEMMGYLSKDLVSDLASSVKQTLPEVVSLLKQTKGNNDPELIAALDGLKNQVAQLAQGANQNNGAIQGVSQQIVGFNKSKERFPSAQFVPTLDLMIKLTQEFAINYANYVAEMNAFIPQMDDVQARIARNSSKTDEKLQALTVAGSSIQKYSFDEIGIRFKSIQAVLTMMYKE